MSRDGTSAWSFLTNHAGVLVCIAQDPGARLRDIGDAVGITERAAHRIVGELTDAGYVSRRRVGRRNQYTIKSHLPIPDPLARGQRVGDLLAILAGHDPPRSSAPRKMLTPPASSRGDVLKPRGASQVAR